MFKINIIYILIPLAIISVVNCYPAKNTSCDCVCGSRENQISGDIDKQAHAHPWLVGVFWGPAKDPLGFGCSGTLISNQHVLISATCAARMARLRRTLQSNIQIRMGNNVVDAIKRDVRRIYIHENYDEFGNEDLVIFYDFDIAIMQLNEPVSFGNNIQPICLPQSPFIDYNNNTLVTAIGLYDTATRGTFFHRTKAQQTNIPLWMLEDCAKLRGYDKKITDNMICAGDHENEIDRPYLHGFDYGQIIFEGEHGRMELVGIYSFGPRSDLVLDTPLVYTRVANFLPWIQSKLANQCMCKPKNFTQSDSLKKVEVPKKQTGLSLQSAKNSSCNCVCGLRGNQERIIDGVKVTRSNRFPWVVGIYTLSRFHSSGALISNKHVISSAETAYALKYFRKKGLGFEIRLGQVNTVKRGISNIYDHDDWYTKSMDFNIGILQLDEEVSFGYNIQPICLPSSSFVNYTGQMATAVGYYILEEPTILGAIWPYKSLLISASKSQEYNVPIWSNEQCAKLHYGIKITDSMICAGEYDYGVQRTCMRELDIGQIVIEREDGRMELVGIYSFGTKCGSIGMPPVYTRVANLLPWIQNIITNQCT